MKNKLMNNLALKILSLIVAFVFWLIIINITDPTTSKTFTDIPVKILNENVITTANQVYEIEDGNTVDVTVKGKRSFVETVSASDFEATADLSELSKVNAVSINVKLNKTANSNIDVEWGNAVLKVKLEKRVTKKFKVEVAHQGDLSENYVLGEMTAKPNIVEVSCGESKFKKIDHVGVMVTLNGESDDFDSEYTPILYDEDGEALDDTNVTFSNDTVKVSTKVLTTKEVPVYVDTSGTPANGYRLVQTDYKPETIRVSGTSSALSQEVSIKIPISVEGAKKDVEKEVSLVEYLPEGLSVVGDTTTVSVRCEIEKHGRRTYTMTSSDIAAKNLPTNCTMEFTDTKLKYTVVVTGKETLLEELALTDLGAYVDLANLDAGNHTLEVKFSIPNSLTVKSKIKVKISLNVQDTQNTNTEPENTETPATETPAPADENNE